MIGFNPDGSIKLPEEMQKSKKNKENKLKNARCMLIRKDLVNSRPPKKCILSIRLSEKIDDTRFMYNIYRFFDENSQVPSKLRKVNDKEYEIDIGTDFRRCSDCCRLIRRYREFIEVIEDKGTCTYENNRNFCYEDYFD